MKKIFLILGLILLIISFQFDSIVLNFFVNHRTNFLNQFFIFITNIGSIYFIVIILTLLFLSKRNKKFNLPLVWTSILVTAGFVEVLKFIIARPRPELLSLITVSGFAFPSFHAAAMFAPLALIKKEFSNKFFIFWIIVALTVTISRIYLGVHYPSDVIAGALLGYLIGLLILSIETKYSCFKKISDKIKY